MFTPPGRRVFAELFVVQAVPCAKCCIWVGKTSRVCDSNMESVYRRDNPDRTEADPVPGTAPTGYFLR